MRDHRNEFSLVVAGAGLLFSAAMSFSQQPAGQQPAALTAREIFYAAPAGNEAKPAQTKAPAAKSTAKAPAQKTEASSKSAPVQGPEKTATSTVQAANSSTKSSETATNSHSTSTSTSTTTIVPVTLASLTRKPLGVRLSVSKNGQDAELPPDTTFRPGDRVRFNIQVSDAGYLYIVNRGSSGIWTPLYPLPGQPEASNAVEPGKTYYVPSRDRNFIVSDPPGEEKLFIVLSREPGLDPQTLALEMSQRDSGKSAQSSREAPARAAKQQTPTIVSQNVSPITDDTVNEMRKFYARDLIIETVDDQTSGSVKENAVYAVNPSNTDDARVVLDAEIKHH